MTNEEVPPKSFLLCPYGEQHYTKDGKYIANFWRRGDKWVYSIQDTWDQSRMRKENPCAKTKQ